jgi:hypothetical protein
MSQLRRPRKAEREYVERAIAKVEFSRALPPPWRPAQSLRALVEQRRSGGKTRRA